MGASRRKTSTEHDPQPPSPHADLVPWMTQLLANRLVPSACPVLQGVCHAAVRPWKAALRQLGCAPCGELHGAGSRKEWCTAAGPRQPGSQRAAGRSRRRRRRGARSRSPSRRAARPRPGACPGRRAVAGGVVGRRGRSQHGWRGGEVGCAGPGWRRARPRARRGPPRPGGRCPAVSTAHPPGISNTRAPIQEPSYTRV